MSAKSTARTPPDELIRGIVQASLELACLRHNLCLEDGPPMVVEQVAEIVDDTFNALQGIDCCDETPCPEWSAIVEALGQAGREGLLEALADAIEYANAAADLLDGTESHSFVEMSELWEKVKRAEALLGTEKERKS